MIDVIEVLEHWHGGRPKIVVAASLGVDPKTVRKYVAPAEAAGLVPGGPRLSRAEWAVLVADLVPGAGRRQGSQPHVRGDQRAPRADPHDAGDQHGVDGSSTVAR
jgi:hypothetical protein